MQKDIHSIQEHIAKLEKELEYYKSQLSKLNSQKSKTNTICNGIQQPSQQTPQQTNTISNSIQNSLNHHLTNDQIKRFSRHLLLPEIGVKGQQKLCSGSVLLIGAGGLGAPAALYLAAAGVGRIGIVDFDVVDTSNLHRQVIHTEDREGCLKVESAKKTMLSINSSIQVDTYHTAFTAANGLELVKKYDVIIDGSDNVATRYLVNDACVIAKKPLVSGCAVRLEGQLTVYNYKGGPCYRCLYPTPPPPESVTDCVSGGVLGVVPGVIGTLQALEAMKILMGCESGVLSQRLLIFHGLNGSIRTVKVRGRLKTCAVCGDNPTITKLVAYPNISCSVVNDLSVKNRISVCDYKKVLDEKCDHVLVDVREPHQYEICSFPNALSIPLKELPTNVEKIRKAMKNEDVPVYVICRRGNQSVTGTKILLKEGFKNVANIDGGILAWAAEVDTSFPTY